MTTSEVHEVHALLADMVRYATESRSPNHDLIDAYAERAARAGAAVDVIPGPTGRANLHLRFGPDSAGGVLLSGHTDVVPAGEGWHSDPYVMQERDGRFYGRGTADMKGFLAAALVAMEAVDPGALTAPVHFGLSYDEEIGCVGAVGLVERLVAGGTCRPELVVVGEPTTMSLCTAHAGKVAHRLTFTAAAGHSSRAATDASALAAAVEVAARVNELNRHAALGLSANVGTLRGGVAVNVLAPHAELTFELRHAASVDPDELLADVWATVQRCRTDLAAVNGAVEIEQTVGYPALASTADAAAVVALESELGGGADGVVGFGCEAGLYARELNVPAVVVGPGDIADAHKPDESIEVAELERALAMVHRTVARFSLRD